MRLSASFVTERTSPWRSSHDLLNLDAELMGCVLRLPDGRVDLPSPAMPA
jgi:hypothetical protein